MTPHLSDDQARRLLSGALPDSQLGRAEAHLWHCTDCRDALRRRTEPAPELPPLSATGPEGDGPAGSPDAPPAVPGYEVLGVLGRGGMGLVWMARHLRPDRTVALKVLRAGLPADADARRRFRAEAEALARLQHPGIVQVYEVGEQAGQPYFALEYCAGGSLAAKLAGAPLPPAEAAALLEAVARAVHHAHRQGLVHRDLKPANILLASADWAPPGYAPKVSDFGLARWLTADSTQLTRSGGVLGTPSYAAPEQVEGAAGPPADVYALGAVLYECLTGRPPFKAATVLETLELARTREPVPVRQEQPGVPRDLETVCLKCLEKEPHRRYPSAEALADDLRRFREGRPVAARPVSRPERLRRWARRNPLAATLATVLALAVTAGLATAFALWGNAAWHLRQEEAARHQAEDNYRTSRQLLAEYVAVTRAARLQTREARQAQRAALVKARAFCEGLLRRRPDDAGLQRDLAEVCTGLAALDAHDGRLEEAREAGETARALWQRLGGEVADARCRDRLAAVLSTLGLVYRLLDRTVDAAASLREAIGLWDRLAGDGTAATPPLLAACEARRDLANLMSEQGYHPEQSRLYEENCARLDRAAAGAPPELSLELLANLTLLGDKYQHAKNGAGAERCWRRGYGLGRRVVEEMPDNALAAYYLAQCGRELAALDPAAAPPQETVHLCGLAARLLEARYRRDPDDHDCTRALGEVSWLLADSYRQAGQPAEALRTARRMVAVRAELAGRHPEDVTARLAVFAAQACLAVCEWKCGDPSAARATARRTADDFERFCAARRSDRLALVRAIDTGASVSPALRHAGAPEESLRVADRCLRVAEGLVRECPDEPRYRQELCESWTQVGKVHWGQGRHAEAEAALRAAAQAADEMARRWPVYRPLREDRRARLGRLLEDRGRPAEAGHLLRAAD
jgi:hypothetical protein